MKQFIQIFICSTIASIATAIIIFTLQQYQTSSTPNTYIGTLTIYSAQGEVIEKHKIAKPLARSWTSNRIIYFEKFPQGTTRIHLGIDWTASYEENE